MRTLIYALLATCILYPSSSAIAGTNDHALVMHGTPKLSATAPNYPYVNPNAPKGGTLRQAAIGTFDTVNPFTLKGKAAQGLSLVHDRLMDRSWDEPFTLYPLIAKSIDVNDDRSVITFHLDPRARFSDGSALTSADVAYSFDILKTSGRPNMRRVYKLIDHVDVLDAQTIRFTLGAGHDRETVMILAIMPVLSKSYWSARPFDAATLDTGVTSGPYKIKSVDPGRRIIYERVKNYWGNDLPVRKGQNNFDQIVYDYFRDESVAFEAFKSGNMNYRRETDLTQWANAYEFPSLTSGKIVREAVPHGRAEAVRAFIPNTRRAPFDDVRVREALSLAFDFTWVNKTLFSGQLKRTTSVFPNTDLAATGTPDAREFNLLNGDRDHLDTRVFGPAWRGPNDDNANAIRANLQRADTLLKSAGWIIRDGHRVNAKTGKVLDFEILLGAPADEKIALSYARSLKRLGITIRTRTLDSAAFRDRLNTFDYDMLFYFWQSSLSPGSEQLLYWGCQAASEPGRFNYAGVCTPLIDRLAGGIAGTKTREDLQAYARALDRALTFGFYLIPFGYNPADMIAHDKTIVRPAQTPLYGIVPETWWQTSETNR